MTKISTDANFYQRFPGGSGGCLKTVLSSASPGPSGREPVSEWWFNAVSATKVIFTAREGTSDKHINFKEVLALEPVLWAEHWRNKKVFVHSDNKVAVVIINKGSCRDTTVMASLRRVFWASAVYNSDSKQFITLVKGMS